MLLYMTVRFNNENMTTNRKLEPTAYCRRRISRADHLGNEEQRNGIHRLLPVVYNMKLRLTDVFLMSVIDINNQIQRESVLIYC